MCVVFFLPHTHLSCTAGAYGTGKRGGGVSKLICAVLEDRKPDNDEEPKCVEEGLLPLLLLSTADFCHCHGAGTARSFGLGPGCPLQTIYGFEKSHGNNGIQRTPLNFWKRRGGGRKIKVMCIWNRRSTL